MRWDLVFTAFLKDLPYGEDKVRCRPAVSEAGLITSHELIRYYAEVEESALDPQSAPSLVNQPPTDHAFLHITHHDENCSQLACVAAAVTPNRPLSRNIQKITQIVVAVEKLLEIDEDG